MVEASEKLSLVLGALTGIESASSGADRDTCAPPRLSNLAGSFMAGAELCQAGGKDWCAVLERSMGFSRFRTRSSYPAGHIHSPKPGSKEYTLFMHARTKASENENDATRTPAH